jgi:hypothetical protein
MRAFKLDADGDLDVTNGRMSLVSGREAIRQKLQLGLRTFLGEWFLDVRTGLPYYQSILVKNPNSQSIQNFFKKAILSCDGVVSVDSISTDFDKTTRHMTISFTAKIDDGTEIPFKDSFVVGSV